MLTVTAIDGAPDLYPGFADGDLFFTITNPNPYPVTFSDAAVGVVTSSDEVGCPASNVTVASATGLTLAVAADSTSATLSIGDVVSMSSAAPDACQHVSFDIAVTLTGTQTT